jgi:hypothetical protein
MHGAVHREKTAKDLIPARMKQKPTEWQIARFRPSRSLEPPLET